MSISGPQPVKRFNLHYLSLAFVSLIKLHFKMEKHSNKINQIFIPLENQPYKEQKRLWEWGWRERMKYIFETGLSCMWVKEDISVNWC